MSFVVVPDRARWPIARQLPRAWRLGRDVAGVVVALARTLRWVLFPRTDDLALAILAGEPLARVGAASTYRLRACNPTGARRQVHVVVVGWLQGAPDGGFRIEWSDVLEPGSAIERRVRTHWHGDAELVDGAVDPPVWSGEAIGRWHVQARAPEANATPILHASGTLVR